MNKSYDVLVIGDCTVDISIDVNDIRELINAHTCSLSFLVTCGGSCNFAITASRLGLRVAVLDILGEDIFGQHIRRVLMKEGIDLYVTKGDKTTWVLIIRDKKGEVRFVGNLGSGYNLRRDMISQELVKKTKSIYIFGYLLLGRSSCKAEVIKIMKLFRDEGRSVFLDPGAMIDEIPLEILRGALSHSNVLLANREEVKRILERLHLTREEELVKKFNIEVMVIKEGCEGARAITRDGRKLHSPCIDVGPRIDDVGAGDAFNAGFIYAYMKGKPLEDALLLGNVLGGIKVTKKGTGENMPTKEEVKRVLMNIGRLDLLENS